MVKNPYRIFQDIIDDCVLNQRKEIAYEYIVNRYLQAGYGLDRARYWIDLYLERFNYSKKAGFIQVK